jgi:hypothetical protein
MIASHPRVGYVDEPFNAPIHPHCPVGHMWHLVTADDEPAFTAYLRRAFRYPVSWWHGMKQGRFHPWHLGRAGRDVLRGWGQRLLGCRPLMKDPIAFFSAEWVARTFAADVVIIVRHPAAFASSLKRLGWLFPFGDLLRQPLLLKTHLAPFAAEIRAVKGRNSLDVIEHAILFWRAVHHVVLKYRRSHPDWTFLRHEDVSARPVAEYEALLARLGLNFPARVRRVVEAHSARSNPAQRPDTTIHELKLNSEENVWGWTQTLTPAEIDRVRAGTADVARHFYADADWVPPRAEGRAA